MKLPTSSVGRNDCNNNISSSRFESPSRSIFIIFQGEYKGPKIKILISGAPKTYQTLFHIDALTYTIPPPIQYADA